MGDTFWINSIRNEGESVSIEGRVSKRTLNKDGTIFHLGSFVLLTMDEYRELLEIQEFTVRNKAEVC
jgi:hypothetical protein